MTWTFRDSAPQMWNMYWYYDDEFMFSAWSDDGLHWTVANWVTHTRKRNVYSKGKAQQMMLEMKQEYDTYIGGHHGY